MVKENKNKNKKKKNKNNKDKNVIKIYNSNMTLVEKVYLCYGRKAYDKFCKKRYKTTEEQVIEKGGVTSLWDKHNGSYECVIGVLKLDNIIQLKGLIVHEITHATDFIMKYNDFTDMEFRAYSNQAMYQTAVEFIDKLLISNTSKHK